MRKFAHNQPFDVRTRRFLILEVCANISYVGIRQADNLACITGIGENFLVTGKAGIKNDFAATAATGARRASLKYSSVFQREYRAALVRLLQSVLRCGSSYTSFAAYFGGEFANSRRGNLAEFPERPIREHCLAVNIFPRHRPENPRII